MTICIAYFSWKGHTRKVAETLAEVLKKTGREALLVEITPEREFKDSNVAVQAIKAFLTMKTPIKPGNTDLSGIDELVIATPIWAGKVPPFVNTYVSDVSNGKGKPFHVVAEMGGRGAEGGISVVRKQLEKKGMRFVSSAFTVESDVESGTFTGAVDAFAAGIGKK